VPAERVDEVIDRTRAAITVRRAPLYAPSRVRVLARSAIVLQLEAAKPDRARRGWPLGALVAELSSAGLMRRETREWTPHVTVARARRGQRPSVAREAPELCFAPDAIAVMESVSVPGGVVYDQRARFALTHAA
jgi:hypothetical protein